MNDTKKMTEEFVWRMVNELYMRSLVYRAVGRDSDADRIDRMLECAEETNWNLAKGN